MALSLATALRDGRALLQDYAGTQVDDAVLAAWLDAGQQDVAALTLCYQRVATYRHTDSPAAFVASQRAYAVSLAVGVGGLGLSDALLTLHVEVNGVPLLLWTPLMLGLADVDTTTTGTPRYYYEFAQALYLVPAPTQAWIDAGYTMDLTYAARPPAWTSAVASVVPPHFDELPTLYAVSRVLMTQRHWPRAGQLAAQYLAQAQSARALSLAQFATSPGRRSAPTESERDDEPHLLRLAAQGRAQRRLTARGGRR